LIREATQAGCRLAPACAELGICEPILTVSLRGLPTVMPESFAATASATASNCAAGTSARRIAVQR